MPLVLLALLLAASNQATSISAIFDDASARQLMRLRRQFDEAELAAIREYDATTGGDRAKIAIPAEAYRRQRAPRDLGAHTWTQEQKRLAAVAWPVRQKKIAEAEALLSARTAAVLKRFGYNADRLPSIRLRKWDGPAVFAFNSASGVPLESRPLLKELRRLWNLSARVKN